MVVREKYLLVLTCPKASVCFDDWRFNCLCSIATEESVHFLFMFYPPRKQSLKLKTASFSFHRVIHCVELSV